LTTSRPVALEKVQSFLSAEDSLLVYLTGENVIWLWVVRKDKISFHHLLVAEKTLADDVRRLRATLNPIRTGLHKPKARKAGETLATGGPKSPHLCARGGAARP
jgi:hypothetical protein